MHHYCIVLGFKNILWGVASVETKVLHFHDEQMRVSCSHDNLLQCIAEVEVNCISLTEKAEGKTSEICISLSYPKPSLERGQHCLLSSALLRHPVRAVKWRALLNFYAGTDTFYLLHLHGAKRSENLSIIQQYGRVSASILRAVCDKTQWHISIHIRGGDKERKSL